MAADSTSKGLLASAPAVLASPIVRKRLLPMAWRFAKRHPLVATAGAVGAGIMWWRNQDAAP